MRKKKLTVENMYDFLDHFFDGSYNEQNVELERYDQDGKSVTKISYPFVFGDTDCLIMWFSTDDEPIIATNKDIDKEIMSYFDHKLQSYAEEVANNG